MKRSNELAHIRQLCALGLPGPALVPALLRSVRKVIACDSAGFFWTDERGDIVSMYAERMLPPAVTRRYFERHYDDGQSFRLKFMDKLARGALVEVFEVDEAFAQTDYYREILKPLDVHRILHAIVADSGRPLGQLSLYRSRQRLPFSADDLEIARSLIRYLAQAVAMGPAEREDLRDRLPEAWRDSELEALLICDGAGEIVSASYRAHALLANACGAPINRQTMTAGALENAGRALLAKLLARLGDSLNEEPVERVVDNDWGRYRLRAYALGGHRFGVMIQRQEHLLVRVADAMRELPLSAQQREVAMLLAQGLTNGEIASVMGVSINTASYHVKQLFQNLDAHDRGEAIARILDGHTARLR
jgi:DNA-binding CsgD family transcriptional regulator/GAF domain-containing protein